MIHFKKYTIDNDENDDDEIEDINFGDQNNNEMENSA